MTLKAPVLLLASLLALAGCASSPGWDEEMGAYSVFDIARSANVPLEKRVLRALTDVKASEPQRTAVLAAFDAMQAAHKAANNTLAELASQRNALDVKAPDYLARTEPLLAAQAQAQQAGERGTAAFQHAVAITLSEGQWREFSEALRQQAREGGLARRPYN